MRTRFVGVIAAALLATAAFGATNALAATEFGDSCAGNSTAIEYTLTTLSAPSGQNITAPVSGVITRVKVNVALSSPLPFIEPTSVKTLHNTGGNNFTVISQTTVGVGSGVTVADARMPVQAGDRLALHGQPTTFEGSPVPGISFYCNGPGIEGSLGAKTGDVPPGSNAEFTNVTIARVPLSATIEPDADNDGYGDETQDKCPTNASTQAPCPVIPLVALSSSATAKRGLVSVLVTSNAQAPVTVVGTAKLGKGKTATLSGGTQVVAPGAIANFTLLFTKALKAKLKSLSRKRSLTLNVTATATNSAGVPSTSALVVKLKGQKKAKHHRKHHKHKSRAKNRGSA